MPSFLRCLLLVISFLLSKPLFAQEEDRYNHYGAQLNAVFQVHDQIKKGTPWPVVLSYLKKQESKKGDWFYLDKSNLVGAIEATILYRSRFSQVICLDTASVDALLAILMDTVVTCAPDPKPLTNADEPFMMEEPDQVEMIHHEFARRGKIALPDLMRHLTDTAATRTIRDNGDSSQEIPYSLRVCDFVLYFIEHITQCDFLDNTQGHILSAETPDRQQKVCQQVQNWWAANKNTTKAEGIYWQLENQFFSIEMCERLDKLGEKDLVIQLLTAQYSKSRTPQSTCFPYAHNLNIARALEEKYNIDLALEDCANGMTNYRCNNGAEKAYYILRYDTTGFWYMALAEVVATEPYTTYHRGGEVWKSIFAGIISVEAEHALPVLIQLMKRKEIAHEPNKGFPATVWTRKYPESAQHNLRVCDFALLQWLEVVKKIGWMERNGAREFVEQLGSINLSSSDTRDAQIAKIIEKYGRSR